MRKLLRFLFWTALILGALVGIARATALRWYRIPSDDPILEASIAPTLRGGDWVILWRLTAPVFGDLVMCPEPDAPGRIVIGRLIGEQRDHIAIKENNVIVNNRPLETERVCSERVFTVADPSSGVEVEQGCQIEVAGSNSHMRGTVGDEKIHPLDTEADVPSGEVYLVSDNRLFPYDSRDYESVERTSCKETVAFRLANKNGFLDVTGRLTVIH